jgi:acyl carrier protein
MPTDQEVEALVIESVRLLAEDFEWDLLLSPNTDSPLYGNEGPLDSMGLVNLIADIEDAVFEKFNVAITLADEKAMSARNSPYLSVKALSQAVLERIAL